MSTDDKTTPVVDLCASCGIAAVDDVKLKRCNDGCDLVKYCSDKCQELHREQHVKSARNGRLSCMIKNYLRSPIVVTWENAQSVVCRCQLIRVNQC